MPRRRCTRSSPSLAWHRRRASSAWRRPGSSAASRARASTRMPNQEVVSECTFEAAAEDEGGRELDEGVVELGSAFPAGRESALVVEPGVGAFDRPALAAQRVACTALPGPALLGDPRLDLALSQRDADVVGVIAAVGQE